MRLERVRSACSSLVLWAAASLPVGCAEPSEPEVDPAQEVDTAEEVEAAEARRKALPGQSSRTVIDQELNEAENLFFTESGRLFVSGTENIFEIKRNADGTFTKTDHFDGNCVVEGIVERRGYLYGVCWIVGDLRGRTFLIGGELTEDPEFKIIAPLESGGVPNGMTVDPEGRIYVTDSPKNKVVRLTLGSPLELARTETWAANVPGVNGIKYVAGAMYATILDSSLVSRLVRIPVLPDGSAGKPENLFSRSVTLLDDIVPYEGGFIITDFLKGTLIFWDATRGAYAETPARTFYGPTSLAVGRGPMFSERQLIIAEKGNFLIRNEEKGDLLSVYQLP